jgi:tRNA threonylcarbamoyladenosine biosynthesis protein TsaB
VGEKGLVVPAIAEQVGAAQQVELPCADDWYGVGSGWGAYSEQLELRLGTGLLGFTSEIYCSARDIAALAAEDYSAGLAVAPEFALPVYLRDKVANKM